MFRVAIALLAVGTFALPVRAELVLDPFTEEPMMLTADVPDANVTQTVNPSNVLGQRRQMTLQGDISSGSLSATVDTTSPGTVSYVSNSPVFNNQFDGRLILSYLGTDRLNTFDLQAALGSEDRVTMDFLSADFGGGSLDAQLSANSGHFADFTVPTSSTPFSVHIPLSVLTDDGLDLESVFLFNLDFPNIPDTGTFQIDNIRFTTVPEPASCLMLSTFVLILGVSRSRSRSSTR